MKNFTLLLFLCLSFPAFAEWIEKTNFGGDARHRATAFSIGSRGYIGLGHVNAVVDILYDDFWEYDPGTNSWTQKADFAGGPRYHAVGFSIGNKAYVGTGRMPSGSYSTDLWEYDPVTNVWTAKANFPGNARRGAVSFVINNKAYVGTGQSTTGNANDFFSYDPATNSWAPMAALPASGRTSSVAFAINNKGYVGTGSVGSGTNDFYEYNPVNNTWIPRASVGPTLRQEATGFAIGGKGYIGTGDDYSSGNNYGDMWEFDPGTNTWVQVEDFGGLARRYLVSFTIGTRGYAGTGTNGTNFKDFWEYDKTLSVFDNDRSLMKVKAWPVPATEAVNIELLDLPAGFGVSDCEYRITTLLGSAVSTGTITDTKFEVSRGSLPAGVYLLSVNYKNSVLRTSRIIFK